MPFYILYAYKNNAIMISVTETGAAPVLRGICRKKRGKKMSQLYLDNASTSFPKPPVVAEAMIQFINTNGANLHRGGYASAYKLAEAVYDARLRLTRFFGGTQSQNLIFTFNVTESLNLLLKGYLKPGDHIIVSSLEHNAVMRPLEQLKKQGISYDIARCTKTGKFQLSELERLVKRKTRAVLVTHASNVCGAILPLEEIGAFCRKHKLRFFVDSAQTAGLLPINVEKLGIDALAFTGHKALLGPQGIGGLLLAPGLGDEIDPLVAGGTGSLSDSLEVPSFLPDKFEAGTQNLPGIIGLGASLGWIEERGFDKLWEHEQRLTHYFLNGLKPMVEEGLLTVPGPELGEERIGVISVLPTNSDPSQIAYRLDREYGIQTRVGLHCSPLAHQTLGTFPVGTVRFSIGWANEESDLDEALDALQKLLTC